MKHPGERHDREAEAGPAELGTAGLGIAELGIAELGNAELGNAEIGIAEIGIAEIGIAEIGIAGLGNRRRDELAIHPGNRSRRCPSQERSVPTKTCGRVRAAMKPLFAVIVIAASVMLGGCKSPCRQLSERQCDCQLSSFDRNTCLQRAASQEQTVALTATDNARCAELVEACDCRLIDTPEGKVKCGFARRAACDADRDAGCLEDGGF